MRSLHRKVRPSSASDPGSTLDPRRTSCNRTESADRYMALRDSWHSALVSFGLAEERVPRDDYPEEARDTEAELEDRYRERPHVRRLGSSRRRGGDFDDIFPDDE